MQQYFGISLAVHFTLNHGWTPTLLLWPANCVSQLWLIAQHPGKNKICMKCVCWADYSPALTIFFSFNLAQRFRVRDRDPPLAEFSVYWKSVFKNLVFNARYLVCALAKQGTIEEGRKMNKTGKSRNKNNLFPYLLSTLNCIIRTEEPDSPSPQKNVSPILCTLSLSALCAVLFCNRSPSCQPNGTFKGMTN